MSITYVDLTRTKYPDQLDERSNNAHFKENINFEDRTPTTDPKDYYILSDDINALQESIISIERTLGVKPQGEGSSIDLSSRLNNIDLFIHHTNPQGHTNLDERYMWGGAKPSSLAENAVLSIKYHIHDGSDGGADKIDLSTHITGALKKGNIDLTSDTEHMLTASDIRISTGASTTISDKLGEKLDKTGGIIDGDLSVDGRINTRVFAEIDIRETPSEGCVGAEELDIYCYRGVARCVKSSTASGKACKVSQHIRYGHYVAGFRIKVADNSSSSKICNLYIKDGETKIGELDVTPSMLPKANEYYTVYVEFTHRNIRGEYSRPPLEIGIDFFTGITDLSMDSIVITPMHTTVFDYIV